jgi:alcohol dehydrogenase (cytochrome c)
VPLLIDGTIDGQPRKLLAQANRNGYYYLLDRTNGKALVVKKFAWSNSYKGVDSNNVLIPDPDKESQPGGTLVFPDSNGATNYPSPAFDPNTGLFYVNTTNVLSMFFAAHDATDPSGFGRGLEYFMNYGNSTLQALDYRTGEPKWTHKYNTTSWFSSTYPGMLATAGGVLFTGDPSGNFVAYDSKTGASLWHAPMGGPITNTPLTLMMDGKQYVMIAAKDALYAFYLQ